MPVSGEAERRSVERLPRVVFNVVLFLALAALAFGGREVVTLVFKGEPGDFRYALGEVAYALVVVAPVALIFLIPGLLLIEEAVRRRRRRLARALTFPVAALSFAPFVGITAGGAEIIPLALGALAYAALLRMPPGGAARETATSAGPAGGSASAP